ncbi:undecaprenyldiphospho-muramoylpentapeptide beta-N-acetylglucosaminyltransferase [Thiomicrorhabdus sp. 6S2-11]|uniref:UDP-N-acetylglucosamine--N-acetylmuramyl-(pentapeptide) pyrophosphoryl-undecaprenol N-acetylglucosamine transferase n=1 Tax=Thiomicrorhabdus marina TaxID=2818442 RepID=A0ABS3Q4G7_9GAMM|nr:undecaprenyldiphospho-muramoylpentapeptide beta-N-acetylglucosaminyltransferase [Thiomicrorhabdus marina]MBO1927221.1 undecaprenyldiphospho-muramoylpentapeptide beta-N-acetylglucosaminyltransferase [Thiomicrorhabdus marina]
MNQHAKKVLIMAGGTGGHVFPGIAIAKELAKQTLDGLPVQTHWLGTVGGMEKNWVEQAQIPFSEIKIRGLRGNGLLGWLKAPLNVWRAYRQAKAIMQDVQPDLVLGMGGFVCGPGGLAAKSLKIPLVIHEQNAIPGLTNRLLSKKANLVMQAFPTIENSPQTFPATANCQLFGNPVREGLEQIATLAEDAPCRLLVLGGSRGAQALNLTVPKALAILQNEFDFEVVHQTGEKTLQEAQQAYQQAGVQGQIVPFIDDMQSAYENASMMICRSGALTVSEVMAAARPAIMVPYPHAVDDHQTANAQALVEIGGGEIIQQSDLDAEGLANALRKWCQGNRRAQASQSIRQQAATQAREKITAQLLKMLQN